MNVFDIVNSISYAKKDLSEEPEFDKEYVAWIVNQALSYYPDTLFYANEMNQMAHIPKQHQYAYYLNLIRKSKRYSKWHKKTKDDNLQLVQKFYKCNIHKAKVALSILRDDQLEEIKRLLNEGGTK